MAEAKQPGGLYYLGDRAVNANGETIEGAPKREDDTPPEDQPKGSPVGAGVMTMRLDDASIAALRGEKAPETPAPTPDRSTSRGGEAGTARGAPRTTNQSGTTPAADPRGSGSGTEQ